MKKILIALVAFAGVAVASGALAGGNIEAGKAAAAKFNCAACHGANFNTPIDPSYPKLAGQHQDYLQEALIAYQRGANGAAREMGAFLFRTVPTRGT